MSEIIELNGKKYKLIEEEKKEYKRWRANKWEDYYAIVSNWEIEKSSHYSEPIHDLRYNMNNYFQTEKEAIKERDKRLAIVRVNDKILELNEWWEPDWGNVGEYKYSIGYEYKYNNFSVGNNCYTQKCSKISYIKSEEIAEQIIKDHQEDLKLIFDI